MADHYISEERGPGRMYTPSIDSEEDLLHSSGTSLPERDYRLFSFRKEGRSWANALCSESTVSESEIRKRARRTKKATHSVDAQMRKMSPPRKLAIEDLLERVSHQDPDRDEWQIASIDNDNPEYTKRNGEVLAFSVILARVNPRRQRTGSMSQDRRRSSFTSPTRDFAVPNRRGSKSYHNTGRLSPQRDREYRSGRQNHSYKTSQPILEDDPFGSTNLFSSEGKPISAPGAAPLINHGLPPHIVDDEPIGGKSQNQKESKEKKNKKDKKETQDDDVIDIDALLNNTGLNDHGHGNSKHHDDHDFEFDEPIVVGEDDHPPRRGRKRTDSGWGGDKTPKSGFAQSKSKSRPRRPSIHIPKDSYHSNGRPIQEVTSRRRSQMYYGSHGSATTPSIHSDDRSILEAEYEEYSSSGSSAAHYDEVDPYAHPHHDGRYRSHRRGPPSPTAQHAQAYRYGETPIEHPSYTYTYAHTPSSRRPRREERVLADGAITRYHPHPASNIIYTPIATPATARPPLISHFSAPRYTPINTVATTHGAYTYDTGLVPFPHEASHRQSHSRSPGRPTTLTRRETVSGTSVDRRRNRESVDLTNAQLYMSTNIRDAQQFKEIELLTRERDLYKREAELHQEVARRASSARSEVEVAIGSGRRERDIGRDRSGSKYTHEPRSSRSYLDRERSRGSQRDLGRDEGPLDRDRDRDGGRDRDRYESEGGGMFGGAI